MKYTSTMLKSRIFALVFASLAVLAASTMLTALLGAGQASAACSALPSDKGTASMTLNVPSAGTYRVWVRMLAPSAGANGLYLQIADANACQVTVGKASIPVNSWTWVDYQNGSTGSKIDATLSAGNHTAVISGLDAGVQVDKILLLSDATCVPTGTGSNCTTSSSTPTPTTTPGGGGGTSTPAPTPTPISLPSPGSSTTSKPVVSKAISIPVPADTTNAQCRIDGKPVDCAMVDTTGLSDGDHVVEVTATDSSGKQVEQKTTITVKNKLTPWEQFVAGAKKYQTLLIVLVAIMIAAPTGFLAFRRFLMPRFAGVHTSVASVMPGSDVITPPSPAQPPAPGTPGSTSTAPIVYPDDPSKPLS